MIKNFLPKIYPILFLLVLIGAGILFQTLPTTDPYGIFQSDKGKKDQKLNFMFEEISEKAGILHTHKVYETSEEAKNLYPRNHMNASVSIADFDNDGKMDLFFTSQKTGEKNYLYKNMGNLKFKDVTEEVGLGIDNNDPGNSVAAAFFDYDNDGWEDLYIAKAGCHKLFKNKKGKFIDVSASLKVDKICAFSTGVNIVDYNRDGYVDLYITNFYDAGPIKAGKEFVGTTELTSYNRGGGPNFLIQNNSGSEFVDVAQKLGVDDRGLSWSSGFSDFDDDGYPDVYIANDFGLDKVYKNHGGQKFEDITEKSVGLQPTRNGMNAEFGDFNHQGKSGAYVTNVSKMGNKRGTNLLWQPRKDASFKNVSFQLGTDRCGFSWGAKFIDVNRDGWLDLITANGFWNDGDKKYWYKWATLDSMPAFLRKEPAVHPPTEGTQMAANQPNCLFMRTKTGYEDVAEESGIVDKYEGRGVGIVDLDNDGALDIIIANHNQKPVVYHQKPLNQNNWVGFRLKSKGKLNIDAIGAKVKLITSKFTQTKENFPANSYASQSDPRIYFGLANEKEFEVEVTWPDGSVQKKSGLEANKYHTVVENK